MTFIQWISNSSPIWGAMQLLKNSEIGHDAHLI